MTLRNAPRARRMARESWAVLKICALIKSLMPTIRTFELVSTGGELGFERHIETQYPNIINYGVREF